MSQKRLTKQEALELITPVVDNEVDEVTRIAFLKYIEHDAYVRGQFESARRIKRLVASRCPKSKAPEELRQRIGKILAAEQQLQKSSAFDEPVYDIPCSSTPYSYAGKAPSDAIMSAPIHHSRQSWMYLSALTLFITIVFWGFAYMTHSSPSAHIIEEHAYHYFLNNDGKFIQPTISTTDAAAAEIAIADQFDLPISVPQLVNAEFRGVVYSDFIPGYKTPLLEYFLPDLHQYVYVFAFDMNTLSAKAAELGQNAEPLKICSESQEFHIRQVKDKYIVSWKSNNTWYAAISNQDGRVLASLIRPPRSSLNAFTEK